MVYTNPYREFVTSNQLAPGLGSRTSQKAATAISPSYQHSVMHTQHTRSDPATVHTLTPHLKRLICCVRFVPLLLRHRRSLSFSSHADTEKIDDDDAAARRPATARKGVRRAYQFLSPSSPSFSSPSRYQLSPQHLAPQCARKERKRPAGTQNSEDLLLRQKIRLA